MRLIIPEAVGLKSVGMSGNKIHSIFAPPTPEKPVNPLDDLIKGERYKALVKANNKPSTTGDKIQKVNTMMDMFDSHLKDIPSGNGPVGHIIGAAKEMFAGTQMEPKVGAYTDLLNTFRPQLARALGDTGRIPLQEMVWAMASVPKVADSNETRKIKSDWVRSMVKAIANGKSPDPLPSDIPITAQDIQDAKDGLLQQEDF